MTMVVTSPYLCKIDRLPIGVLAFERAMCFIYDRPTHSIMLLDTHMHFKGRAGSVLCQFKITYLMNKVHKGNIFVPMKSSMSRVHSARPLRPIRIKAKKMVCVGHENEDEDSGYESSS
ncbi:hypothetical protein GCK72_017783 [Caenorhabditis remanei]|uniref:Uncharacterized protein n=1 Tax=Caenorhabditis remanei TaxID=31234 RepID=A0A6A5G9S4_CAERE|nr:hypothetical protein GCK72_017783 [Caenorhabditis remanei]KAF1751229.1 hypothetical protein GCK72_017783 [Caenorhabditis remanei]